MDTTINDRVRSLVQERGLVQKSLAQDIGMTTDALSRALSGQRGFGALELARIAEQLDADVYELITGEPDPSRLRVAARHTYDHETRTYSNETAKADQPLLEDIRLAYKQAYRDGDPPPSTVLGEPDAIRNALGEDFVRRLADRLEERLQIDVVRIPKLGTAYSMFIGKRAVIVIPASGNWYRENWDIAHEIAHLADAAKNAVSSSETSANGFAARLLLPEAMVREIDWTNLGLSDLGQHLWDWGVSTEALRTRLASLHIAVSDDVSSWLAESTPQFLRIRALPAAMWTALIERQREAASRRFPTSLSEEHERAIAAGRLGKGTLAWMLGVDVDTLEVAEPVLRRGSAESLGELLGLMPS